MNQQEPIAIIGSSCRFAGGASSPSKLWDLILSPSDLSSPPPSNRFHLPAFYHQDGDRHGHTNITSSYFLEQDPRTFDACFFNISPREAEAIDPQQRMLLEVTYEAIESAGLTLEGLQGSDTSVYVGLMIRDYMDIQARDPDYFSQYMVTGTSSALNANRISYFFDWRGPSLTIDTACSSSLVAVHQAVRGLRSGESRLACVAATNLLLGPELFISAAKMRMLSPRSRMWDEGADGYARGDGVATLVLKTLSNAIADGNHIEAIIRQTGVNSDGRTQGITLPSPQAQTALIRETYREAGLDISKDQDRPQYFEAHGTGTQAGDPLEASAIHQAFFGGDISLDETSALWVGSVKTVIGHTEGTAGLAGLLKAILAIKNRTIPPNLHFRKLNPKIAPFSAELRVPTVPVPWPRVRPGMPLRASVNSFGFGGTNAHVILESFENANELIAPERRPNLLSTPLLLSAHTERALQGMIAKYSSYLKTHGASVSLRDLAHTLRRQRSVFPVKTFFSGTSTAEIALQMDSRISSRESIGCQSRDTDGKLCVLGIFTGQGAHWPGMGRRLLESSRLFSETIDSLEADLARLPDAPPWSLRSELLEPKSASRLREAALSQPLCTAIAIALVDLLRASGIRFSAVVGHSSGEIGAAYAAGVITASEAIRIAYYRGVHAKLAGARRDGRCRKGGMIAVGMGLDEARTLCSMSHVVGRLQIAASNSPSSVTLSGDLDAIKEVKEILDTRGIFARRLQVDTAYHSFHMDSCAEPYMASLRSCKIRPRDLLEVDCAWFSSVYGSEGAPTADELGAQYWKDNMVRCVLFSDAVERAVIERGPFDVAIEVGPHPALKGPVTKTIRERFEDEIHYVATLERQRNDVVAFGDALASLWTRFGPVSVDFETYIAASEPVGLSPPSLVKDHIPSYPWDHSQLHWRESRLSREYRSRTLPSHELLGHLVPGGCSEDKLSWRNIIHLNEVSWTAHHRVRGGIIAPTSALCLMAIEAGMKLAASLNIPHEVQFAELQSLNLLRPIPLTDSLDGVELRTTVERLVSDDGDANFAAEVSILFAPPDGTQQLRRAVAGRVVLFPFVPAAEDAAHSHEPSEDQPEDPADLIEADDWYASLSEAGTEYTGPFRTIRHIRRKWRQSTALLEGSSGVGISTTCGLDPCLLESCIQGALLAFAAPRDTALWSSFLPSRIDRLSVNMNPRQSRGIPLNMRSRILEATGDDVTPDASFNADVEILDGTGSALIEFEGLRIASTGMASARDDREVFLQTVWKRNMPDGARTGEKYVQGEIVVDAGRALEGRAVSLIARRGSSTSLLTILAELFPEYVQGGDPSSGTVLPVILDQHPVFYQSNFALRDFSERVSHRFANLNILELGHASLGPSKHVLEGLATSSSYTFASTSAPQYLWPGGDVRFVSLTGPCLSRAILISTFEPQEFDVIVVSYSLDCQTPEMLDSALDGLRHIMTPGGFLVLVGPTEDHAWSRLFSTVLRVLNDRAEDSRDPYTPLSAADLDRALRRTGFGGIDTQMPLSEDPGNAISVVSCQAVDEKVDLLHHPLLPSTLSILDGVRLLLIGGGTCRTKKATQILAALLEPWASDVVIAESFLKIQPEAVCHFAGAIVLADIDCPVVDSLSTRGFDAITRVFRQSSHILWVTSGSLEHGDPGQAASVGLVQTLAGQHPHCKAQLLDMDSLDKPETTIASRFLRLLISSLPDYENRKRLDVVESQIMIRDGCEYIPRVLPIHDMNDRLNSKRRVVKRSVPKNTPVSVIPRGSVPAAAFHAEPTIARAEPHDPIAVSYSLPFAVKVSGDTYLYFFTGLNRAQESVLGFSTILSSAGQASAIWKVPEAVGSEIGRFFQLASSVIIAQSICDLLPSGESIIFEPSPFLANFISDMTKRRGLSCRFVTSRPLDNAQGDWISISPHASKAVIRSALARMPTSFFTASDAPSRLASRIRQLLTADTQVYDESDVFRLGACTSERMTAERLAHLLGDIGSTAVDAFQHLPDGHSPARLNLSDLLDGTSRPSTGLSIVDWTGAPAISTVIESLKPALLLSCPGTYLLIYLEDQLLQSTSHWLVSCGVRSLLIVNQTRGPWTGQGLPLCVSVQFAQADLSDALEVRNLIDGVKRVAGVIYAGAGPHRSCLGGQLNTLEEWKDIMRGSQTLSEALMVQDPDFFVIISSMGEAYAPVGSSLRALACEGHSRGLAVSIVHLDAKWKPAEMGGATRAPLMRISESDMHYVLTEAIAAAKYPSRDPVFLTGIKRVNAADVGASTLWPQLSSPLFLHHSAPASDSDESINHGQPLSVRERLFACNDEKTASTAIQKFFLAYLARLLNLVPDNIGLEDSLASFGVDSLSASDVRAWFLKEVDADISMIRILGGASVAQLCDEAASSRSFETRTEELVTQNQPSLARPSARSDPPRDLVHTERTKPGALAVEALEARHSASEGSETSCSTQATSPFCSAGLVECADGEYFSIQKTVNQSLNQYRFWFPSLYLSQKTPFNCTTSYSLHGPIDVASLEAAFKRLIQRHEIFRTAFFNDKSTGDPMQCVLPTSAFALKIVQGNCREDYEREFRRIQAYVFDLATADTFIASIISHGDAEHTIITGYHHIIMDGVSWQITLRDLAGFYKSENPELPPMAQYADFAVKQWRSVARGCHAQKMAYWRKEFPTAPPEMPLFPFSKARTRRSLTSYDTRDIVSLLDASLVSRIKKASVGAKSTSFHFYLAAFAALAHRSLDLNEICLGIVDANRSDRAFLSTIGCFIDMLPLRIKMNSKERFNHTISSVRKKAYCALENSGIPLETLIQELQIPASATANPLFQVLINYRLGALRAPAMGDAEMRFLAYEDSKAPFDLTLSIDEKDDGTGMLTLSMQDYMFDSQGAELLVSTYVHLLEFLSDDPSRRLNDIPLASEAASRTALQLGTGPPLQRDCWPQFQTISQRVDLLTRRHPHRLAVKDLNRRSRSYLETARRVDALARVLSSVAVTHGSRVAAYCEPSVDFVACILATHRVGATFIPLDVRNSPERLRAIVEECDPALILCDALTRERVRGFVRADESVLDIDAVTAESTDSTPVPNVSRLLDGAFILYTSGSTGTPKGILLTQANISLHCAAISDKLGLTHDDVFLQQSALGFDAALGQMLYSMTSGGSLILGNNRGDPRDLAALMEGEKISFTLMIVSEMTALLQSADDILSRCANWRLALCGGEAFPGRLCSRLASLGLPDLMVLNAYGPTEGSIIASMGAISYGDGSWEEDAMVPCGPPLPSYGVYILDHQLRPVPVGWPGELCIAGPCVASGYVGQPALTAAKFKPLPSCLQRPDGVSRHEGWDTIYRTGDRARMLHDGSFVFLGRIDGDTQVKLRGIRIELGEISSAIIKASAGTIIDAATLVRGIADQILVSFVVFRTHAREELDEETKTSRIVYLRRLVQSLPLPIYMRPAIAIALDRLPITARGKLDTKALAAYELPKEEMEEAEEIFTRTEQRLMSIWRAIMPAQGLKIQIRKSSDFFSVGGNSLLLIRVRAAVSNTLGLDISLAELFHASTLESLAARIDRQSSDAFESLKIDWEAETTLDPTLPVARAIRHSSPSDLSAEQPITVILTGSTGFLGRELVRQFIANPRIARIHCIAVRRGGVLPASDKITIHGGDLSDRLLGLDEATARLAFSTASVIIHNGAEVSHMKSYQTLRRTNVDSTKQLVDLSLRVSHETGAPVPHFHYVSSAGVGGLVGAPNFPEMSVSSFFPDEGGQKINGYVAAKYVSERLLEGASTRLGLPVTIHRPSNITGTDVQDRDIVHSIWRWSERMRAVPDLIAAGATGAFDFVGVDNCAAGIVASVLEDPGREHRGARGAHGWSVMRHIHQSGDEVVPFEAFGEALEKRLGVGVRVAVLPFDDWVERAVGMGLDELVAGFLRQTRGALRMPLLVRR